MPKHKYLFFLFGYAQIRSASCGDAYCSPIEAEARGFGAEIAVHARRRIDIRREQVNGDRKGSIINWQKANGFHP